MAITIMPVTPDFAAEIGDVDLTRPLPDAEFAAIQQVAQHALGDLPDHRAFVERMVGEHRERAGRRHAAA